jgi:hypothetical protein
MSIAVEQRPVTTPGVRRFGYVIAIAVNVVMIYVVNNILSWGIAPFLTEDFSQVVGWLNLSLAATVAANITYLAFDPPWFRSASQALVNLAGLMAIIRMYDVFPFDFTGYEFPWDRTARILLILAMVGTALGVIAEVAKLVGLAVEAKQSGSEGVGT